MNTNTSIKVTISLAIALAVLFGGLYVTKPTTVITKYLPNDNVGAVSGPDIFSTYLKVNGVNIAYRKNAMVAATTTPCAVRSPTAATSTLLSAQVDFTTSSTSAAIIHIAKAATFTATTTLIQQFNTSANTAATFGTASSTLVFSPGEYLVVGMSVAGSNNTFSPTGTCSATFMTADK